MRVSSPLTPAERRHARRWIWVCRFADGSIQYPTGFKVEANTVLMAFSDNKEEALSASGRSPTSLTVGWPYLLGCHARETGQQIQGVLCRANQSPRFSTPPSANGHPV